MRRTVLSSQEQAHTQGKSVSLPNEHAVFAEGGTSQYRQNHLRERVGVYEKVVPSGSNPKLEVELSSSTFTGVG